MAEFKIQVYRTYRSRHMTHTTVEADTVEAARALVTQQLESGEFDPTDTAYTDTQQVEGYDDAGPWVVIDD